eukprot:gene26755-biopygen17296
MASWLRFTVIVPTVVPK